ncbi:MAG: SRPBCC domain-containing protein [Dehalococcoidia bacterium]
MTRATTETLELEARVAARPETIFPFLSSASGMRRWFGKSVELEPTPGGKLRVDINGRDIAAGEVVEIVPNERVVFTFGWEGDNHPVPAGSTRVEISLTQDGDATIVRLRHSGLTAEQAASHKEGWDHYLPRLTGLAEGRDPGADPWGEGSADMEKE